MNKKYLKVETGEPYQPIRLTYQISDKHAVLQAISQFNCIQFSEKLNAWQWQRISEVSNLQLLGELDLEENALPKINLGLLTFDGDQKMYISFHSYERAYLAIPYFYRWLNLSIAQLIHADIYNKFTEQNYPMLSQYDAIFNNDELKEQLITRQLLFEKVLRPLDLITEQALLTSLKKHANFINQQPLLEQERYLLHLNGHKVLDEAKMLSFTYALMLRELVARRRWLGEEG